MVIAVPPTPARDGVAAEIFSPLIAAMAELCERYSDAEPATICDFMRSGIDLPQRQIERLGASEPFERPLAALPDAGSPASGKRPR